ncbi:MAG TPA: GMC family oxidoreductase [Solirubrobacterales bacterium]|nr:GMC family oxidoreductase [Solirubrobacterales bacterium]
MKEIEADIAIVGSGVCGLLSAWKPLQAGLRVAMLERGALKTHAQQLTDRQWAADVPGASHNDETAPGTPPYPWSYVYGVGGSTLHWDGATPRFSATDFKMRSAYGVMVDWPLSLEDLLPYYRQAEQALGVAGAPDDASASSGPGLPGARALPPHRLSPMDRAVAPLLSPFEPLPQARPSRSLQGRPACCGSATCELCPVDARFSPLNGLQAVLEHPGLRLHEQMVAARLRLDPAARAIETIDAIDAHGGRVRVRAKRYVLAASGFENPAILLRSGLERPALGRYLFDHAHTTLTVRLRRNLRPGHGDSLSTGLSQAFREGRFRSRRSAAIASPFNPGTSLSPLVAAGVEARQDGERVRTDALATWGRTLPLDVLTEDVPQAGRRVSLAANRDAFGLPLNSVSYPDPTRYELDGIEQVVAQVRRRLAPLGAREVEVSPGPRGGHLLGTCRMGGGDDAVVDAEMRHLDFENLFVAGGSAFPTYAPVHPTLTIAALSLRLGNLLAAETG